MEEAKGYIGAWLITQGLLIDGFFVVIFFFVALGTVYLFGRMMNIVKSDTGRNTLAFWVMCIVTGFYVFLPHITLENYPDAPAWVFIFVEYAMLVGKIFCMVMLECILYVLVGFTLAPRMNHLQDKFIADDVLDAKEKRAERARQKKRDKEDEKKK